MKISSIKQQVKRPDRYSIFVDGKYSFSLNESQLLNSGLKIGQEINKQELKEFKELSDFGKIYDKTLNLISFRPRSQWEIEFYLKRKKQPDEVIEKVTSKLKELGYLDDKKFAISWIENRRLLKPISLRKLNQELRQKRVPDYVISEVLKPDEETEQQALKELVSRKKHRYTDKLKFMQYLARQGFNYDDIKQVLEDS